MKIWFEVCRFHLLQRMNYFVLPLAILAFGFFVDVVVLKLTPAGHSPARWVGGLGAIDVLVFVLGVQSVARSLPYALSLGITRRTYYVGTALLAAAFGATYGLLIALGQVIERATDGWGFKMAFFRVPYILDGSWYLTWLTSGVVLALLFVLGTWFGLAFRRWNLVGAIAPRCGTDLAAHARGGPRYLDKCVDEPGPLLHDTERSGTDRITSCADGHTCCGSSDHNQAGHGLNDYRPPHWSRSCRSVVTEASVNVAAYVVRGDQALTR